MPEGSGCSCRAYLTVAVVAQARLHWEGRLQHHGCARSRKLGEEAENICREAEKPQFWFEVAARYGSGQGGAVSGVEGDFGS